MCDTDLSKNAVLMAIAVAVMINIVSDYVSIFTAITAGAASLNAQGA